MNLRKWLFREKMTVTQLSSLLKTSRTYVHHLMSGHRNPSENMLQRLRETTKQQVKTFKEYRRKNGKEKVYSSSK